MEEIKNFMHKHWKIFIVGIVVLITIGLIIFYIDLLNELGSVVIRNATY